jgi:plasmid stabilization system protein ParE
MKVTFEPAAQDDLDRIFAWPYIYKIDGARQEIVIVAIAHGAQDRKGKAP